MQAEGYTDEQMIEVGLLREGKGGKEPYAFFRERIIFPVPDRRGRVVAFGGRILPDHIRPPDRSDYTPAKYMNSSDTPLFHKGSQLYGEPRARQAAIDGHPVIVVEGYVDVMACVKAGYGGAVAPLGTALTEEQIMVLWRMIPDDRKVPILCFDGDSAGRRAAARACERILPMLKPDHSARFAFLPEGQDPDSLVNGQGTKALSSVINAAMPLVDFLWMYHTADRKFDTPEDRAGLVKSLESDVLRIPDRDVQHYYRQAFKEKTAQVFGQSYGNANQNNARKSLWGKKPQEQAVTAMKRPSFSREKLVGQVLLASILNHPVLFDYVEEDLGMLHLQEGRLDALRQAIVTCMCEGREMNAEDLQRQLCEQGFSSEIKGLLSESVYTHARFARPQSEIEDVQEGWQQAMKALKQA